MISKIINDIKFFFSRLFSRDGKTLLMLSIIAGVLAVLEVIFFLFMIRTATRLNIPFLLLYTYFFYFFTRFLIRGIQFVLVRINVLKYGSEDLAYLDNNIEGKVRKYNSIVYLKERDRYGATIVYIFIFVIFFLVILHFVLRASVAIKVIITLILLIPFLLFIREPYEIISITNVTEDDLYDMTKKDFFEDFMDRWIFKERQVISPIELPDERENLEKAIAEAEEEKQQPPRDVQPNPFEGQMPPQQPMPPQGRPMPPQGGPMPPQGGQMPQPNPFDINSQIDNNQITGQWWQQ